MKSPFAKGKKVCVIDDEDDIREMYMMKFRSGEFEVFGASNGEAGLNMIRRERPDIILLDLQMPVMNGLEVLEELEKDSDIREIPVVILSNADDEKTLKEVGEFETRFYLVKALSTPQKVMDIVREVLH